LKYLRVEMPDGSKWDVPASVVADNRAKYYAEHDTGKTSGTEYQKVYKEEYENLMGDDADDYDIEDWAANNMNWSDVKKKAKKAPNEEQEPIDYQEGWVNGEKEIVEY